MEITRMQRQALKKMYYCKYDYIFVKLIVENWKYYATMIFVLVFYLDTTNRAFWVQKKEITSLIITLFFFSFL